MLVFAAGTSLSARMDARANAGMKPSLMLCSLRIWPLPHLHEQGHLDLVEGREICHGVLRLLQAHTVHLRARFIPTARSSGSRRGFGLRYLWSRRGWGGFCFSLWWGKCFFPLSGGGGEVSLGFSTARSPTFFRSSGRSYLGN